MAAKATPTQHDLPLRAARFPSLTEALEYASRGDTGFNFYNGRGELYRRLPYSELCAEARLLGRKLIGLGHQPGDRMVLIAETGPEFVRFFFACQYAGLVPVPVPAAVHLGGRDSYVHQLRKLLSSANPSLAMAPGEYISMLEEAGRHLEGAHIAGPDWFDRLEPVDCETHTPEAHDLAYLQYTSGSTRFPRGVMITQAAVMDNLRGILEHGMEMNETDRCVSWLPYYHDMGLVGLVLGPMASQRSVDYIGTRDFAMRPRLWAKLIAESKATISFSPPFGYELCARRLRESDVEQLDLSSWRVAGVGAETIRPSSLENFSTKLAAANFDPRAFLACYGMAECSLAISFASLEQTMQVDHIDSERLELTGEALEIEAGSDHRANQFVRCGRTIPGLELEVRDPAGNVLPQRQCGIIFVRGASVMTGYFSDPDTTAEVLSPDGWLNTGDMGYRVGDEVVVTGRQKDVIIVNGRNIWPQDLEHIAERQPEVRPEDASAFAVTDCDGADVAVMVVQCRTADPHLRAELAERLRSGIQQEFGIDCRVELVPPHTLPRTSSGKLSRSGARRDYLQRHGGKAPADNDVSASPEARVAG